MDYLTAVTNRTAILVNTMGAAAADLWRFLILFLILNFGFIALGMAQFAGEKEEFDTIGSSFETLWYARRALDHPKKRLIFTSEEAYSRVGCA